MDSPNLQKGNKLLLPKIEYNRLEKSTDLEWNTAKSINNESVDGENIELCNTAEGFPLKSVEKTSDRPCGFFTKFSVLPPIQHQRGSRGEYCREKKRSVSETEFDLLLNTSGRDLDIRSRGQKYVGRNNIASQAAKEQSRVVNCSSRPSSTPTPSHIVELRGVQSTVSTFGNENNPGLTGFYGSLENRASSKHNINRRFAKFKRFNSDTSNIQKDEENSLEFCEEKNMSTRYPTENSAKTNMLISPSQSKENVGLLGYCSTSPRPLSRCHIDINMNETENINLNLNSPKKKFPADTSSNLLDISPSTALCTDELSLSSDSSTANETPASIQILIDSLDTARDEVPEQSKDTPSLSIREQRRRSALCRVNSKQVDDFLLVHNLKDLGLL